MSPSTELHVVPAPPRARGTTRLHDPDHPYVEGVWLAVLGPAAYVVWRHLARLVIRSPRATISLDGLAAATGLGPPRGQQSPINRALRRLGRFDMVHLDDDRVLVRTALPLITGRQLARLDPAIQAIHRLHRDRTTRTAS